MKAKNMTRRDAIPYLEKLLERTEGKKKRRALEIAIGTVNSVLKPRTVTKIA